MISVLPKLPTHTTLLIRNEELRIFHYASRITKSKVDIGRIRVYKGILCILIVNYYLLIESVFSHNHFPVA